MAEARRRSNKRTHKSLTLASAINRISNTKVFLYNEQIPTPDSFIYALNVIPDQYPTIQVQKFEDSLDNQVSYFVGTAADDYGISSITFNYTISNEKTGTKEPQSERN